MDATFVAESDGMPPIYKVCLNKPTEIKRLYTDILGTATATDIEAKLARYVSSYIEPVDWQGIWRTDIEVPAVEQSSTLSTTFSSGDLGLSRRRPKMETILVDFEVDVIDVAHDKLEAMVIVRRRLSPPPEELTSDQLDLINDFMNSSSVRNIPLKDLYVISPNDNEERFFQTALLIEQVRFFYRNIWRPWDDLSDSASSEIYINNRLDVRLGFYFDIRNNLVTESIKSQASFLLGMAKDIRKKLDKFSSQAANSEYFDETEISEAVAYKIDLENIQRHFELLENPTTRSFALRSKSSSLLTSTDEQNTTLVSAPQVHLVVPAENCTIGIVGDVLSKLQKSIGKDVHFQIQCSFVKAVREAKSGDQIILCPGHYSCDTLPWIEQEITITGFTGKPKDVTIEPTDLAGDIFINFQSPLISMSHVTIKASMNPIECLLMAHEGNVNIVNCIIDAGETAKATLEILDNASVSLEKCRLIHVDDATDGITCREKSTLVVDGVAKKIDSGSQAASQDTNLTSSQQSEDNNEEDVDMENFPTLTPMKEVGKKVINTIHEILPKRKRND